MIGRTHPIGGRNTDVWTRAALRRCEFLNVWMLFCLSVDTSGLLLRGNIILRIFFGSNSIYDLYFSPLVSKSVLRSAKTNVTKLTFAQPSFWSVPHAWRNIYEDVTTVNIQCTLPRHWSLCTTCFVLFINFNLFSPKDHLSAIPTLHGRRWSHWFG